MGPFDMLNISASALTAERQRSEIISTNMANAETTHTDDGGPFKRKEVVFASSSNSSFHLAFSNASSKFAKKAGSVRISQVVDDTAAPVMRYEPGHPDANTRCRRWWTLWDRPVPISSTPLR
jgi:flagellar basal-body rod protein FlgC